MVALQGAKYAGLWYSDKCVCGNYDYASYDKLAESECDRNCSGNPNEKCGGHFETSIYATGMK